MDLTNKYARMMKRYEDCREGRMRPISEKDSPLIESELTKQEGVRNKVLGVIKDLQGGYPQLSEVLERVGNLAEFEFF